jgi:hypothetical protein
MFSPFAGHTEKAREGGMLVLVTPLPCPLIKYYHDGDECLHNFPSSPFPFISPLMKNDGEGTFTLLPSVIKNYENV